MRDGGALELTESAVTGNSAANVGGGIYGASTATVSVTNSVITGNSSGSRGGGIRSVGTTTIQGSIVANNTGSSDGPNLFGTFQSNGNNRLTSTTGASGFTHGINGDHVGAVDYVVTTMADSYNHVDDAVNLSTREAIDLANIKLGTQEIWLPGWRFVLTRAGADSSSPDVSIGDLDVLQDLTMVGVDDAETIIDATLIVDDVFHEIGAANLTVDRLTAIDG